MKPPRAAVAIPSLLLLVCPCWAEVLERVIVKVNGEIVTQSEFEARQVAALQQARIGPDKIEAYLRENNARILQEAVDELLLLQRAAELNMKVPADYLREVIDGIRKENNLASEEALQEQLRREGMSLDDLKRNIERSILTRQVVARELEKKLVVNDADARADYEARRDAYTKPANIRLQEILVKGDDASTRAAELVSRARLGEDFAALARAHSTAPTRSSGGDLGRLAHGEMAPEIERVAFALDVGAISEPIATADGYRILRVSERTEGTVVPFESVKAEILQALTQARRSAEYDKYLEGFRKTAMIDVRVREVPLQVSVPLTPSTLLEPPAPDAMPSERAAPAPGVAAPAEDSEFTTTPQARPERVVPGVVPGDKPEDKKPPTPPPSS